MSTNFIKNFIFTYFSTLLVYLPVLLMSVYIKKDFLPVVYFNNYRKRVLFNFISMSSLYRSKICNDISSVDHLSKWRRLKIYYSFLSLTYNFRFFFNTFLNNVENSTLSISHLFSSANWLEREVYDMFGVYFQYHPNLTRILTDYGFKSYPMLKVFPVTGTKEIFFSKYSQKIIYFNL